jgi:hypothetical protein
LKKTWHWPKQGGNEASALQTVVAERSLEVQLPLWAEVCRGVPNSVLRSALFGVVRRGPRSFQQRVQKASVEGIRIIHTGPQLDQADLDVWEQALQLARTGGLGCRIQFTASQFLKSIGRGNGKSQHEWLKGAFARLAASVVEIKDGHRAYFGAILSHGGRDDQTGRYVIEMNPKLIELYGLDGWSSVEFDQRMALKKRPLAQWLHGYYSSHAKPFPVKVETLHRLCGSQNTAIKAFRQDLRSALEKLEEVTHWTLGNRCFRLGACVESTNGESSKASLQTQAYPQSILSYPQKHGIAPTKNHGIAPTGTA